MPWRGIPESAWLSLRHAHTGEVFHGLYRDDIGPIPEAMIDLAASHEPEELASEAFALYEKFRPPIPAGEAGWGAKGELDTATITALAKR